MHLNDVRRIAADARARQRNAIALPPRPVVSEQSDVPESSNDAVSSGALTAATR